MILFLFVCLTTICTTEELSMYLNKLERSTVDYKVSCEVLESELENICNDICTENATGRQKRYVYNTFNDVFVDGKNSYDGFIKKVADFRIKMSKYIKGTITKQKKENIRKILSDYKNLYMGVRFFNGDPNVFLTIYNEELLNESYVIHSYSTFNAVLEINRMLINVVRKFTKITDNFKKVFEISEEMFGKIKKSGDIKKTIMIVMAIIGGFVVIGLMIYEFYLKNNENQRNIEFVPEQTEVEEIPDDEYDHRNGVPYENSNLHKQVYNL